LSKDKSHDLSNESATNLYLDLLRDVITNSIYSDPPILSKRRGALRHLFGITYRPGSYDAKSRNSGGDWPSLAHSMIGMQRMENVRNCAVTAVKDNVPGDFIETGVWRGGACIMMRGVLKALGDTDRTVWVADSFAGLPKPNAEKYAADKGDDHHQYDVLAVSVEDVKNNFRKYGLLDDQVKFLKGWFSETLPKAPIEKLSVLRLDGDMYESTMDALVSLYPKVSSGGFVVIDDYHAVPGCKQAVHDYLESKNISVSICEIDGTGVYWRLE